MAYGFSRINDCLNVDIKQSLILVLFKTYNSIMALA